MRLDESTQSERAAILLADLIALPTVNPMGRPYGNLLPVERPVIEYLEKLLAPFGVQTERQACSPIHESLLITVPGSTDLPGILFESHIDTVPADDWADRAFTPRIADNKLNGRGACDDKGSFTAMVLALVQLLEANVRPNRTIWLLAAGDEEHAQTGICHFITHHPAPMGRAIIGEPTDSIPVIQQKGVIRWDITVHGRSAHTSQPENGRNAILDMLRVIEALARHEQELRLRYQNPLMTGPTISVTMIGGGCTRNAVPDECTIAVDFRPLPQMDRVTAIQELKSQLHALGIPLTHSGFQCNVPGQVTPPDDPFVQRLVKLSSQRLGRKIEPAGVPYGSDACWIPAEVSTVVLGPGDISQAHTVEDYVDLSQIETCVALYHQIMQE